MGICLGLRTWRVLASQFKQNMINHKRRKKLLKLLSEQQRVSVSQLVDELSASAATIRRDIAVLAKSRQLRRVHGGAEHLDNSQSPALLGASFQHNTALFRGAKRAIAQRAVTLCREGESIIINGGSTTHMMAEYLKETRLSILTNSFLLAQALLSHSHNDVLVPGGMVYRDQNVIASPFDNDAVQNYYASKMFIGATGVSALGLLEVDPLLVRAEQMLVKQCDELIVLVDSSKFESWRAGLIVCPLARVSTLITDQGVSATTLAMLRAQGVEVIVVAPEEN